MSIGGQFSKIDDETELPSVLGLRVIPAGQGLPSDGMAMQQAELDLALAGFSEGDEELAPQCPASNSSGSYTETANSDTEWRDPQVVHVLSGEGERSDEHTQRADSGGIQYARSAYNWVQQHILYGPTCQECSHPTVEPQQGLSLAEMTTFIRTSTLPDVLSQGPGSALPPPSDPTWPHVLTGSSDPPPLKPAKSHQPSSGEARRYDIDAFIAEATSLQALRGLRFSYYPKAVNNLQKPIHVWFHGRRLHRCRHIRFGEGLHHQQLWVYIAFPRMPCDGSGTLLTDHQHALWIDRVVLPSIREVMPPASCQHLPLTWECGVAKMRANYKEHRTWDEGGQHAIHYAVQEKYLSQL
ncbi:hypothetical protein PoHVEF18_010348 [Penicillium ochrochloron]